MKSLFKWVFFPMILVWSIPIFGQTNFIKYRNYLIPIQQSRVVITDQATEVTDTSVNLQLTLEEGVANTLAWFAVSTSDQLVCDLASATRTFTVNSAGTFTRNVTGLAANTGYFYRACVSNPQGQVSSGAVRLFNTAVPVTVATDFASEVLSGSAVLNGRLLSGNNVEVWFAVALDEIPACTPTPPNSVATFSVRAGERFSETRLELEAGSRYQYRACAKSKSISTLVDSGDVEQFSTLSDGGALSFSAIDNRTDSSIRLTGHLNNDINAKNTWFVIFEGRFQSLTDQNCANGTRSGRKVLRSLSDRNIFSATGLSPNTWYTVGFCGENLSGGDSISVGGVRVFRTKRNTNIVVDHNCSTKEVFSSKDGPLLIRVNDKVPAFSSDSSHIRIRNFSRNKYLQWDLIQSGYPSHNFRRFIEPRHGIYWTIVNFVRPNGNGSFYEIAIDGDGEWEAEFQCASHHCFPDFAHSISCPFRENPLEYGAQPSR